MEQRKSFNDIVKSGDAAQSTHDIHKFNPYHGPDGRFTTSGAATSFTYRPGASRAHDLAIAREKERAAAAAQTPEQKRSATIKAVENKIRNQNYESAALIDSDGKQLFFKDGEASQVAFSSEECRMMRGMTLTHNHPNSSMFSTHDIKTFVTTNLTELRAVGKDGTTYSIRRTNNDSDFDYKTRMKEYKFWEQVYPKQYNKAIKNAKKTLDDKGYAEKIARGEITQEFANKEFQKLIASDLSKYMSRYGSSYGFEFSVEV